MLSLLAAAGASTTKGKLGRAPLDVAGTPAARELLVALQRKGCGGGEGEVAATGFRVALLGSFPLAVVSREVVSAGLGLLRLKVAPAPAPGAAPRPAVLTRGGTSWRV